MIQCIRNRRVPHAILIAGPAGAGKAKLARSAAAWYCFDEAETQRLASCPNYSELSGRTLGVEDVRALTASTGAQGFNGGRRAYVIADAHLMRAQSQNALLKTLEEPPKDVLLILTGNEAGLLPTVRSRCLIYRVGAQPYEAVERLLEAEGVDKDTAALAARLSDGILGKAHSFVDEDAKLLRERAMEIFTAAALGVPPFEEAAAAILSEKASDGKKKKADPERAERLLHAGESLFRDALIVKVGGASICNIDQTERIERLCRHFTLRQIQSIIELFISAQTRLAGWANPQMTVDALLARLSDMKEQL